jgi:hypothetical protein
MVEKPSKLQPALVGGLVLGLGSVIPIVSIGNLCCCGWGIVGGALAGYLLIRKSPVLPITKSDGASAGALAGVVGSLIYLVIGVPLNLLQWNSFVAQMDQTADSVPDAATREIMTQMIAMMQNHPVLFALGVWVVFAIIGVCVAALGGLIGVAIFGKRKGQQYPPQPPGFPPSYGGTPAGGTGAGEAPYGAAGGPPTY